MCQCVCDSMCAKRALTVELSMSDLLPFLDTFKARVFRSKIFLFVKCFEWSGYMQINNGKQHMKTTQTTIVGFETSLACKNHFVQHSLFLWLLVDERATIDTERDYKLLKYVCPKYLAYMFYSCSFFFSPSDSVGWRLFFFNFSANIQH